MKVHCGAFLFFRTPVASSIQSLNRREWWLAKLNGNAARDKGEIWDDVKVVPASSKFTPVFR